MASTSTTKDALGRIVKWLKAHKRGKAVLASLRPPASAAAIAKFEKKAKVALPPALAALYRLHDGQDEDAANAKLDGDTIESGLFPSIEGRDDLPFLLVPLAQLARALNEDRMPGFRKGWIPFGDNYGGDNIVLDLASTSPKKRGRVLQFNHEFGAAVRIAPSFEKYLEHIADGLASKKIIWDDDSGLAYKKGKDWEDLKNVEYHEEEEPDKPSAGKQPEPSEELIGRWKVIEKASQERGMMVITGYARDTVEFTSRGDFIVTPPPRTALRRVEKYRFRCDTNHHPAWLDLSYRSMNETCLAIYRVKGDELVMSISETRDPRPDRLDWKPKDRWVSCRMKRA